MFNLNITKVVSAGDATAGYLAVLGLDVYDRPISLVFSGDTPLQDGGEVDFSELDINHSVNLQLLEHGLVYPAFYTSMPDESIALFTNISI